MNKHLLSAPLSSKGRLYDEKDELKSIRTPYERDRDRIIHSNSFRKLKHKTQVFIESDSDYYRTRLTHSLEVAQISRSLCRAMKLNEDLGEVVSLAHDLGHPPFGHNGEKTLNNCMDLYGGFNHNDQTLRVITKIEKRHPHFDGLNLTWESLEGIAKHNGAINTNIPFHINQYNSIHNLELTIQPHLESQVATISDDITMTKQSAAITHNAATGGLAITSTYGYVDVENLRVTGNVIGLSTDVGIITLADGAVAIDGTLDTTGDFKVDSTKFTVDSVSGNTAVAGTLNVTGAASLSKTLFFLSSRSALTLIIKSHDSSAPLSKRIAASLMA